MMHVSLPALQRRTPGHSCAAWVCHPSHHGAAASLLDVLAPTGTCCKRGPAEPCRQNCSRPLEPASPTQAHPAPEVLSSSSVHSTLVQGPSMLLTRVSAVCVSLP
eukprot:2256304-Amphidinium_carterae.1